MEEFSMNIFTDNSAGIVLVNFNIICKLALNKQIVAGICQLMLNIFQSGLFKTNKISCVKAFGQKRWL